MTDVISRDDPETEFKHEGENDRARFRVLSRLYTEAVYEAQQYVDEDAWTFPEDSTLEFAVTAVEELILEKNTEWVQEVLKPTSPILSPEQEKLLRKKAMSYFRLPRFSDQGNFRSLNQEGRPVTSIAVWSAFNNLIYDNNFGGIGDFSSWHNNRIADASLDPDDPTKGQTFARFTDIDLSMDFSSIDASRGNVADDAQPTLILKFPDIAGTVKLPMTSSDLAPDQWGITSRGRKKSLWHTDEYLRTTTEETLGLRSHLPEDTVQLLPVEPVNENGD